MITRAAHFYWGKNQPLSYMRYLTVKSFQMLNPDWEVNVWVPTTTSKSAPWGSGEQRYKYSGFDYSELLDLKEFDFSSICIPDNTPEVHKSDLLRWYLLGTVGGLWSDMDVLYTNPVNQNIMEKFPDIGLCRYPATGNRIKLFQAIGFLTSGGVWGKAFFYPLFEFGLAKLPQKDYQAFGATLLDKYLLRWKGITPSYINHELVYPWRLHQDVVKYFTDVELPTHPDCIGYHWFAGNPECSKREVTVTEDNIKDMANKYAICREAVKLCL